jgi:hypothetical protein
LPDLTEPAQQSGIVQDKKIFKGIVPFATFAQSRFSLGGRIIA